jgi:RNA polymerase sigma factor (sigma-70 family)
VITGRKDWALGPEAFEKLLGTLDPDRDRAAERYEFIRQRLIQLFRWRGCSEPEALADETIDRVSRKLMEGEEILSSDPAVYFYGVARNVLKEFWTEQRKEQSLQRSSGSVREFPGEQADLRDQEMDERLDCLDRCLALLPKDDRELIATYYRSEKSEKIAERAELAKNLGLSPGALRIRAHRIRRLLEEQVTDMMRKRADG